jgi:hypothetical protein
MHLGAFERACQLTAEVIAIFRRKGNSAAEFATRVAIL